MFRSRGKLKSKSSAYAPTQKTLGGTWEIVNLKVVFNDSATTSVDEGKVVVDTNLQPLLPGLRI